MNRHLPSPGPGPWSWRCQVCSKDITDRRYHRSMIESFNWWNVALSLAVVGMIVYYVTTRS